MTPFRIPFLVTFCAAVFPMAAALPAQLPLAQAMDALLAPNFKADQPGAVALVVRDGQVVFHKAYGLGSLELQVPVKPDSVFDAASSLKSMTSAGVMKLVEEGKLDVKAPLSRYLPGTPAAWVGVTVENCLTHSSGIRSLWEDPAFGERSRIPLTPAELRTELFKMPLAFEPGTSVTYSTANYSILALLIEQVSGQSFQVFIETRFLKPLGMNHTTFAREDVLIPGRVSGYTFKLVPPGAIVHASLGLGGGDYASTAKDMITWLQALLEGRVVSATSLRAMTSGFRLKDGQITRYGFGLDLFELQGQRFIGHTGDGLGFHAALFALPEAHISVAVLYNGEPDQEPAYFAKRLAALALGKPILEPKAMALPEAILKTLVGHYSDGNRKEEIRLEKGQLQRVGRSGKAAPIYAISATEWFFDPTDDTRIRFVLKDGHAVSLSWENGQHGQDPVLQRVD